MSIFESKGQIPTQDYYSINIHVDIQKTSKQHNTFLLQWWEIPLSLLGYIGWYSQRVTNFSEWLTLEF